MNNLISFCLGLGLGVGIGFFLGTVVLALYLLGGGSG